MDVEIAVIGGGPAGLHAAWKAALLHRSCALFDSGRRFSRIFWSPRIDNIPGRYPVSGRDLIEQGYADIEAYEAEYGKFVRIHKDTSVDEVRHIDGGFEIRATGSDGEVTVTAKVVVLATGCVDTQPKLRDFRKRDIEAVLPYGNKGLADYCLLCDGHTVKDKDVAVIGCDPGSRGIAKSLKKNFGARTAIIPYCNPEHPGAGPQDPKAKWADVEADLDKWDIPIHYGEIETFTGIKDGKFEIVFEDGRKESFDKAWISMGWYKVNNEHAQQLGARLDDDGFVVTDKDGRVLDENGDVIPKVYAIGDLRSDSWKQIPIAWGEAEAAVVDAFIYH